MAVADNTEAVDEGMHVLTSGHVKESTDKTN